MNNMPPKAVKRGTLILLSGVNGVGKDEQSALLIERARQAGMKLRGLHVLTLSAGVAGLRTAILSLESRPASPLATALAFLAAHAEAVEASLEPRLERGENILLNRGPESTLIFNIIGPGLDEECPELVTLHDRIMRRLAPDKVFILDAPVEVTMSRSGRQSESDQFQEGEREQHQARRQAYLDLANRLGWTVVHAEGGIEEVNDVLWSQIRPLIKPAP